MPHPSFCLPPAANTASAASLAAPALPGLEGGTLRRTKRFRGAFPATGEVPCPGCWWWVCICAAARSAADGKRSAAAALRAGPDGNHGDNKTEPCQ